MPMITETSVSPASTNSYESVALNFASAVAKAVGGEVKTDGEGRNYVLMDKIGYPGWCFCVQEESNNTIWASIYRTKADGGIDSNDLFYISYGHKNKPVSATSYESSTCVMLYDTNKDTVLFNVHRGETTHGTDITVDGESVDFTFFFAKDVNNDILCGIGRLFISTIRTSQNRSLFRQHANPQKATSISNSLHLTKMVNYLSPGCPEMKSAYVSVMRPLSDSSQKYVALYEINGATYGRASFVDSWDTNGIADGKCYYPFDPFVKY